MRNRSPANSAASSPPVPARTSRMALRSRRRRPSAASSSGSSCSSAGERGSSAASSSRGHGRHLLAGSRIGQQRAEVGALGLGLAQVVDGGHHRVELGELLGELDERRLAGAAVQLGLDGFPALHQPVELLGGDGRHVVRMLRKQGRISRAGAPAQRRRRAANARLWAIYRACAIADRRSRSISARRGSAPLPSPRNPAPTGRGRTAARGARQRRGRAPAAPPA